MTLLPLGSAVGGKEYGENAFSITTVKETRYEFPRGAVTSDL